MTLLPIRILIADDDTDALAILSATLEGAGYVVCAVTDGEAAVQAFRAESFDLVMLDIEMPGLSGYEVCAAIRREAGDGIPIVMVTGRDNVQSIDAAYNAGATDFIAKPIMWGLVAYRVRYLLRSSRLVLNLQAGSGPGAGAKPMVRDSVINV